MMLMSDGTVKLMDFGIAKAATDRKLTMTGTTMGSLYYMSPEQISGLPTLDARSDLYSVGVSLYELVTGKRPFDGDSQFAIMSAHLQQNPVPPIVLDPTLPQALNDLILLSVNREAAGRFQSAEAFHNALSGVAAMMAPTVAAPQAQAPRQAAPPPPAAPRKSHRALWATVGALCCVGILVAAIQFGPWRKAAANSPSAPPPAESAPVPAATVAPPSTTPVNPTPAPVTAAPNPGPAAPPGLVMPPASAPASKPGRPAASQHAASQPQVTVPSPQTATQPSAPPQSVPQQTTPAAPVVQAPPQPDLSAQRAELQKVREGLVTMSARAASIHSTIQNLQRSQAASGLGMRGDWLQSVSLMDSFLRGSTDALNAGDAPSAKDLMEKAERQIDKMEKALNK
jgi:serine/threonine-protein kinase